MYVCMWVCVWCQWRSEERLQVSARARRLSQEEENMDAFIVASMGHPRTGLFEQLKWVLIYRS